MTTETARHVLKNLEQDLRSADFDALSRDELHRFNRAVYRWHLEVRARLHGKPRQTAALTAHIRSHREITA